MTTLVEFLLTRIAEDEARAKYDDPHWADCKHFVMFSEGGLPCSCGLESRLLAECEAKRRIVEDATDVPTISMRRVLRLLALPYADHPDYKPEWAVR
jgi:hypothetical protein